ncbi:DCN1-like protein 5 [Coemansia sp. RSA 2611]|nr:DCN1-like protein 5 [Coemansia sp. RSA 2705]KAJ2356788.1 DCN1-like protein 5 [Coemansia sp. RSA 2610]KAJ2359368.1 DCN1-like protein 5 [Coemansia sp. RSA 2611]KAJ2739151.1 DCN1-like protein 5 [Coemansia sp. Cherry 401B]
MAKGNDLQAWFIEYQDLDRSDGQAVIMPEGFERLCGALEFDMDGIEPMALLWRLNAAELGKVEFAGWESGMRAMNVHDTAELKQAIRSTIDDFGRNAALFKSFYRKMFDYLRADKQKSVAAEDAVAVLPIVTGNGWVFEKFVKFLEANGDRIKTVSRDQWQSLLELSKTLKPDLSNYSSDDAWPAMFDELVEWLKKPETA